MVNSARTDEARSPFLAQAIAFPADGQHMAVVEQAVEDGGVPLLPACEVIDDIFSVHPRCLKVEGREDRQ